MAGLGSILRALPGWARVMLAVVLAVIVYLAGIATGERSKGPRSRESPAAGLPAVASAEVVRVIDGDTIEVRIDGGLRRVRYIGMDTPERDECYRQESTSKNEQLVAKKRVRLERDVSETDRFGRLLRSYMQGNSSSMPSSSGSAMQASSPTRRM